MSAACDDLTHLQFGVPREKSNITVGDHVEGAFRLFDLLPFLVRQDLAKLIFLYLHDSAGYNEKRASLFVEQNAPPSKISLKILTPERPKDATEMHVYELAEHPGLKLYLHHKRGGGLLTGMELVDRKGNHIYLEKGDGLALSVLAPRVP